MSDRRVFISHHEGDRSKAEEIVSFIEARDVPAWLASRDAEPGTDYSEQIEDAISGCSGFVVVVTEGSSASRQVRGETDMAFRRGKPIFPIRFDDIDAGKGLRLYLAVTPWTDAFGQRRDQNLGRLASALRNVQGAIQRVELPAATEPREPRDRDARTTEAHIARSPSSARHGILRGSRSSEIIAYAASLVTIFTFVLSIREIISSTISAYWIWALGLSVLILLLYLLYSAYTVGSLTFALTDISYKTPIVGKLARYSRSIPYGTNPRDYPQYKALYRDYVRHINMLPQGEFLNNVTYLRKALDLGRRPMPAFAIGILIILISLESMGISYLLSLVMFEASTSRSTVLIGIVVILASIIAWTVHAAGHELHRTGVIRSCFRMFRAERGPYFTSRIVSLADDQSVDDDDPAYVQCANRTIGRPGDLGSYAWLWLASLLVLSVATGLTVLRIETLDSQSPIAELLQGPGQPDEWGRVQTTASLTGFAILATIFVVTQCIALGLGFWYGFSGRESPRAYVMTRGHSDFTSYSREARRRIAIADLRMTMLHRLLDKRMLGMKPEREKGFIDFLREDRAMGSSGLPDPDDLDPAGPRSEL